MQTETAAGSWAVDPGKFLLRGEPLSYNIFFLYLFT